MNPYEAFLIFLGAGLAIIAAAHLIEVIYDSTPRFRAWMEKWLPEGDEL